MARLVIAAALLACAEGMSMGSDSMMERKEQAVHTALARAGEGDHEALGPMPCKNGMAGEYPCKDVDLISFTPRRELYGSTVQYGAAFNDIWGWTDKFDGHEYVIMGALTGTTFVDITDPKQPVVVAFAETGGDCTGENFWRDIKTVGHYAYVVADNLPGAGLQVVDLRQLRGRAAYEMSQRKLLFGSYLPYVPYTIPPLPAQAGLPVCDASTIVSVIYNDVLDEAHNLVAFSEADIEAGAEPVIIAVGASDKAGVRLCGGGMAIFGLEDPMVPEYLGCFGTRYTHDAQCVLYHGPDKRFTGRQLCFLSNTNEISVVDITDKNELELISTVWGCDSGQKYYAQNPYPYLGNPIAACDPMFPIEMETPGGPYKSWHPAFVHQGWLSEDHSRFVMGDEVDEETGVVATVSTYYFDVSSLLTLKYEGIHASDYIGVDHNLYIDGKLSYHADYTAGMRVRTTDFAKGTKEVGFFDVAPDYITGYTDGEIGNGVADVLPSEGEFIWLGSWSLYPFFASGVVAVSSVDRGLFLLKYTGKK